MRVGHALPRGGARATCNLVLQQMFSCCCIPAMGHFRPLTVRTSNAAAEMAKLVAESQAPPSPTAHVGLGGPSGRRTPHSSRSSLLASPQSPKLLSPSVSNASPRAYVVCRICEERVPSGMLERHSQVRITAKQVLEAI